MVQSHNLVNESTKILQEYKPQKYILVLIQKTRKKTIYICIQTELGRHQLTLKSPKISAVKLESLWTAGVRIYIKKTDAT